MRECANSSEHHYACLSFFSLRVPGNSFPGKSRLLQCCHVANALSVWQCHPCASGTFLPGSMPHCTIAQWLPKGSNWWPCLKSRRTGNATKMQSVVPRSSSSCWWRQSNALAGTASTVAPGRIIAPTNQRVVESLMTYGFQWQLSTSRVTQPTHRALITPTLPLYLTRVAPLWRWGPHERVQCWLGHRTFANPNLPSLARTGKIETWSFKDFVHDENDRT